MEKIIKLNRLIECSICLRELNVHHKMLPCQHIFCLVCLNELTKLTSTCNPVTCPECQSIIPMDLRLLSTNIMVMCLIEAKSKLLMTPSDIEIPITQQLYPQKVLAKAIQSYSSKQPGVLSFNAEDLITIHRQIVQDWYQGELNGKVGIFNILSVVVFPVPLASHIPQCRASTYWNLNKMGGEGFLSFSKGDIITDYKPFNETWGEGRIYDKHGKFPMYLVTLNQMALSLKKSQTKYLIPRTT